MQIYSDNISLLRNIESLFYSNKENDYPDINGILQENVNIIERRYNLYEKLFSDLEKLSSKRSNLKINLTAF